MSDTNSIWVKDLVVNYMVSYKGASGSFRALYCPELEVAGGTSVAVMGPSGCGKSTLLGVLAGLSLPSSGTVSIGGTELTSLPEAKRVAFRKNTIGMVYQADNLLPFLSVSENIRLQLALCADTLKAESRTTELLEQLGLSDLAGRLPDQLSGGQRQRVAVARAIVQRPAVILADEPTGALDEENAARVVQLLLAAHRQMAATLIIVTHDPWVAEQMEHLITLRDGSIAAHPEAVTEAVSETATEAVTGAVHVF